MLLNSILIAPINSLLCRVMYACIAIKCQFLFGRFGNFSAVTFCLCLPSLARTLTVLTVATTPTSLFSLLPTKPAPHHCFFLITRCTNFFFSCEEFPLSPSLPIYSCLPSLCPSSLLSFLSLYSLSLHVYTSTYSPLLTCPYLLTIADITPLTFHSSSPSSHTPHHTTLLLIHHTHSP
jgi:hypothetical protein